MLRKVFFWLMCFLLTGWQAIGQQEEPDMKAAFIYNFTKYIEWSNNNDNNYFIIGVIGDSPVYNSLKEIAASKTVDNKKIILLHFSKPEDITDCQILFISAHNDFSLPAILSKVNRGTLTISEETGYAEMGTDFNFIISPDNKLRFEANTTSIAESGIKASAQLLKLAHIVN